MSNRGNARCQITTASLMGLIIGHHERGLLLSEIAAITKIPVDELKREIMRWLNLKKRAA